MEDPKDTGIRKCDVHCHREHVDISRRLPRNNHMVGMDWVITPVEKLEVDLCTTIDDGNEFLRIVEEIRNSVAKYQGEVTRLDQHQQGIFDGLMEAMDSIEKKLVQVDGQVHEAIRVGKDAVYIRVTYIYAYCIARIQYSTRLLGWPSTGAIRASRRRK